MDIIVKMKFGSHLYGTNTEDSDTDYKGIFMPTKRQIYLGQIPKSCNESTKNTEKEGVKNSSDDIDTEIYSLHYFIKLALEGQTVALDMLHANDVWPNKTSFLWERIRENRSKFYTKNLGAFVSYARKQAAKYGVKGTRLNEAKKVLDYLDSFSAVKLKDLWDYLPTGEHVRFIEDSPNGLRQYQVCGKILQETSGIEYTCNIIKNFLQNYGKRAEMAARNEGIDWKAISHAFRAAYQVKQLLEEGTITFPLREAGMLKSIKAGELDFNSEVSPMLEALMVEVECLSEESDLPTKPDTKFWEDFIVEEIDRCYP